MEPSNNDKMIILKRYGLNTAYGNVLIDGQFLCIFEWSIKIIRDEYHTIGIGIAESNKWWINTNYLFKNDPFYSYFSKGEIFSMSDDKTKRALCCGTKYGEQFYANDIIKMEVNTKEKTIRYYKNGKDLGIAVNDINFKNNIRYNLAVVMGAKNDCIQLIDFKMKFRFNGKYLSQEQNVNIK